MTIREVVDSSQLEILAQPDGLDKEITGGYASDLLSDVIAHSKAGNLWITMQTHRNIIAVATLKELAAVVLVNGRTPDPETLEKAREEKVIVLGSRLPAFELVGRLYQMGIRGIL
jgi:serine kinase of HPr protein (carbohydrate metabolism regulator)